VTVEPSKPGSSSIPGPADLTTDDVRRRMEEALAAELAALGCFNLAVFGKTGAGKSTLVNAIFRRPLAQTGIGKPVTKGLVYHRPAGSLLGLYDSEGFETGSSGDAVLAGLRSHINESRSKPFDEHIHAVWYCVRATDLRFEDGQAAFVKSLAEMGLPVIVVLTQTPARGGQLAPQTIEFGQYIRSLGLPIRPGGSPVATNAIADTFLGTEIYGLEPLLEITYAVTPEVAQGALSAAQMVSKEWKRRAARRAIDQQAALAGALGATPIPFSDAVLLVPNQIKLIARITAAYGIPAHEARSASIAGAAVLTGGATLAGRYIATSLLKFVPGGNIAGMAISAGVAASLTKAVGHAWMRVCDYAMDLDPQARKQFLESPAVRDMFLAFLNGSPKN